MATNPKKPVNGNSNSRSTRSRVFVLNDPYPMRVSGELAAEIGLNESIVLLQLEFLLSISRHIREGRTWTHQTLEDLQLQFPWWSRSTIARILDKLEKQEFIVRTQRFNNKTDSNNRRFWYRLNPVGIARLESVQMEPDEPDAEDAGGQPEQDPEDDAGQPDGLASDSQAQSNDHPPISQNEKWSDNLSKSDTYAISQNEKWVFVDDQGGFLNLQDGFLKMRNLYTHRLLPQTISLDLPSVDPSIAPTRERSPADSEAGPTDRPTEQEPSNQTSESSTPVQLLEEHEAHHEDSDAGDLSPKEDEDNAASKPEDALRQQVEAIPASEVSDEARHLTGELLTELPALSERDQLRTARLAEHYHRQQRTSVLRIAASGVALYATQQRIRHPFSYLLACCVDAEGERSEGDEDLLASLSGENTISSSAQSESAGYGWFFSSDEQESDAGEDEQRQHTPEPDPEALAVWEKTLEDVSGEINAPSLRVWFEGTVPTSLTGDTLTISVPNGFARDYIGSRFKELLEGALARRLSPTSASPRLEIVVGIEGTTDNTARSGPR